MSGGVHPPSPSLAWPCIILHQTLAYLPFFHSHCSYCTNTCIYYVYWTVHHLDSWIKRDQLDVTCFIISLFTAQHVTDVNISILRSLRFICWVISWVVLFWIDVCWCYVVVWLGWCGIRMQAEAVLQPASNQSNTTHEITHQINRKLLRMDVLTSEACWAVNNEIIKQVTSSWSLFIHLSGRYVALQRKVTNDDNSGSYA